MVATFGGCCGANRSRITTDASTSGRYSEVGWNVGVDLRMRTQGRPKRLRLVCVYGDFECFQLGNFEQRAVVFRDGIAVDQRASTQPAALVRNRKRDSSTLPGRKHQHLIADRRAPELYGERNVRGCDV